LAENAALLKAVDYANVVGLLLIGAALMLGLWTRLAAVGGILLLALYYLAYPPFVGSPVPEQIEGAYLIVNKNLVELLALAVVVVLPAASMGLDGILAGWRQRRREISPSMLMRSCPRGVCCFTGSIASEKKRRPATSPSDQRTSAGSWPKRGTANFSFVFGNSPTGTLALHPS
jgi:thiosulfate dehydrogenase [quinone] large subunit